MSALIFLEGADLNPTGVYQAVRLFEASTVADGAGPWRIATMVQLGLDSVLSSTDMLGSTAKTKARHPLLTSTSGAYRIMAQMSSRTSIHCK